MVFHKHRNLNTSCGTWRFLLAGGCLLVLVTGTSFGRTWTSKSGQTLEADLETYQHGTVTLRTPDRRTIQIAADKLSPEDQLFLRSNLPDPIFTIQDIRLKGWERRPDTKESVAVFEVRAVLQNRGGVFKNPDLVLEFNMDTSERYKVQESRRVHDPSSNRSRNVKVDVSKKREGAESGTIKIKLFKTTDDVVDTSRMMSVIERQLVSSLQRKDKTTYRITKATAKIMIGDKVITEFTED